MEMEFSGEIWFWKGPSPFHFVTVPEDCCDALDATAGAARGRRHHDDPALRRRLTARQDPPTSGA